MSSVWWKGVEGALASDYLYKYYLNYDSDGFSTLLPFVSQIQAVSRTSAFHTITELLTTNRTRRFNLILHLHTAKL